MLPAGQLAELENLRAPFASKNGSLTAGSWDMGHGGPWSLQIKELSNDTCRAQWLQLQQLQQLQLKEPLAKFRKILIQMDHLL